MLFHNDRLCPEPQKYREVDKYGTADLDNEQLEGFLTGIPSHPIVGIDSGCTRFKEYQGLSSYPAVTPQLGRENQNPSVLRLWSSGVGVECYKSEVL